MSTSTAESADSAAAVRKSSHYKIGYNIEDLRVPFKTDFEKDIEQSFDLTEEEKKSLLQTTSLDTANQREINQRNIGMLLKKYQRREGDTGSTEVQIAVLSEKIRYLTQHFALHNKDKKNKRGFQILQDRRRKLLKYLKRERFRTYQIIMRDFGLDEKALETYGQLPTNRPFLPKAPRTAADHRKVKLSKYQ